MKTQKLSTIINNENQVQPPYEYDYFSNLEKLKTINQKSLLGKEFRQDIKKSKEQNNEFGVTNDVCKGHVQLNHVVLHKKHYSEFIKFCNLNPQAFPLLEISYFESNNNHMPITCSLGVNVSKEIGKHILLTKDGNKTISKVQDNIDSLINSDYISIGYGCSYSLDQYFTSIGLTPRHILENKCVSMYKTKLKVIPYGKFSDGNLVVTMRPFKIRQLEKVIEVSSRLKLVHGLPVYYGLDYEKVLGINLENIYYGDLFTIKEDEIPVFWACGLTFISVFEESIDIDIASICYFDTLLISDLLVEDILDL